MKKGVKIFLIVLLCITIVSGIVIPLLPFMLRLQPAYGAPSLEFPIAEPMNITSLAAYNTPNWGDPGLFHNGIDLKIENATDIISPCHGIVLNIHSSVNPYKGHIMISVNIIVNLGWTVGLVFEPYANETDFHELQLSLIVVKAGQRVQPGDLIGTLLNGGEYPHLHYMVNQRFSDVNPYLYSSDAAQLAFEEIATRTNTTIYYP
ncbi:MAG: M23 family metallopeptidase [Candidatus Heimdallarchaeota archaeon]